MTLLSHSPSDMPERRAASRALSRASGRMPFTLHGTPNFILEDPRQMEQMEGRARPSWNRRLLTTGARGAAHQSTRRLFPVTVNKPLRSRRSARFRLRFFGWQAAAAGARWNSLRLVCAWGLAAGFSDGSADLRQPTSGLRRMASILSASYAENVDAAEN